MNSESCVFFHLSFPGGGGLFPLLLGKGLAFREYLKKQIPGAQFLYSGISSGSFVALLLALELSEREIHQFMQHYLIEPVEKKWYIIEQFHMWYLLKRNLRVVLGNNGYKLIQGKYRVGVSKVKISVAKKQCFETQIIDEFQNSEEVVNAILTSSHMALLGRQPFRLHKKALALDGGLTCDHVTTEHLPLHLQKRTITFRIGYETFPRHLLLFQQAMPMFTQAKWERMSQEGKHLFEKQTRPQLDEFLQASFVSIPMKEKEKGITELFEFIPLCQLVQKDPTIQRWKDHSKSTVNGLTSSWIEMVGGYTVWGLLFTWRFIFNNPL